MNKEPAWKNFLSNPAAFSSKSKITVVQTHISWVFISEHKVVKIKKPVNFGFLDFSTLEKRKFFCKEEVRLNKRLCPDIYLEAIPLTETSDGFEFNGSGKAVEWMVVMNRMPEKGMMQGLIQQNEIGSQDIDNITDRLVPFYKKADGNDFVQQFGTIATIKENTEENFEQTRDFKETLIDKELHSFLEEWNSEFIESHTELFNSRITHGKIKEGHGDLYSANIHLDRDNNTVHIFDCIEFNNRFRCGDIAVDIAFLAMDLDYHGLVSLSRYFISKFVEKTDDQEMLRLIDFYKCYRAVVRGKIGCFTWASEGVPEDVRQSAGEDAKAYFKLAGRYAGHGRQPVLYAVFGLSGTGKSTVANIIGERKGCSVFSSDLIRKEVVAGISTDERRREPFGKGIYTSEMTERTYRAMHRLTGMELMRGHSVVCDATYSSENFRQDLIRLANAADAEIRFIHCTCNDDTARERLDDRDRTGNSPSDGRWEIFLEQKKHFAPIITLPPETVTEIDTSAPLEEIAKKLL